MAGTQVYDVLGCNNPDVELVCCLVTYSSGVPSVAAGKGISSCSDDGTGLFTLTLAMNFSHLVGVGHTMLRASAQGGSCQVVDKTPSSRTIQFRIVDDADSAEDPSDDDGVYLIIAIQRSGLSVT